MARLVRDGVGLVHHEEGRGTPELVFVHGLACNRHFWPAQVSHFKSRHRVVAVDLRGHGDSDAPEQEYTIRGFAEDLAWVCGSSLGEPSVQATSARSRSQRRSMPCSNGS